MKAWVTQALTTINIGAIAEQFVAQELVAYAQPSMQAALYYWHRESPASNAEVDSHPASRYGVKISEHPFAMHGHVREVPLYSIEAWLKA